MVRNYIPIYKLNIMNNKLMTDTNIRQLLDSPDISEGIKDIIREYTEWGVIDPREKKQYEKLIAKKLRELNKDYIYQFLTLSPDHNTRALDKSDVPKMEEWANKWFTEKRYSYYNWVLEYGEDANNPHYHIHALVLLKHKKQGQNHARELKKFWAKYFPNSQLIGKDYLSKNVSGKYFKDKELYFDNSLKGSHENFMDSGIRGQSL